MEKNLNALWNKVTYREVADVTLDTSGVLRFKGMLCVSWVGGWIHDVLSKAYGSFYSIHLGTTKMYGE